LTLPPETPKIGKVTNPMRKSLGALLLLAVTFSAGPRLKAQDTTPDGSINVGAAALFQVLTTGDLTEQAASSIDNNTFTGPSYVLGNVGIGARGNFSMSDGSIDGDLYMNDYGTLTLSGPAKINGTKRGLHQNGISQTVPLTAAINSAQNLSDWAGAESSTSNYTVTQGTFNGMTVNTGNSITIADANPFGGSKIVLNLQDFVLTNGKFTLQGSPMTTYIINVSRNFSINNSSVVLAGGLLASHVLFNVRGGGSQVSLNQGTSLHGILLAMHRKVSLSGGKVFGRVMAQQLAITSGGQVVSE